MPFGGAQNIGSEPQIIGHRVIHKFGVLFCFVQLVTVPWYVPLEVRNSLTWGFRLGFAPLQLKAEFQGSPLAKLHLCLGPQ